jgi:hypothetical protein
MEKLVFYFVRGDPYDFSKFKKKNLFFFSRMMELPQLILHLKNLPNCIIKYVHVLILKIYLKKCNLINFKDFFIFYSFLSSSKEEDYLTVPQLINFFNEVILNRFFIFKNTAN